MPNSVHTRAVQNVLDSTQKCRKYYQMTMTSAKNNDFEAVLGNFKRVSLVAYLWQLSEGNMFRH